MSLSESDLARLREATLLAPRGRFAVEPNPVVGCVLVNGDRVVGEGWHAAYGGPHAEAAALANAQGAARGATAYVSLEPCDAFPSKKTPSCAAALAAAGVARVVFAASDPNPAHAGRGAERLRQAGIRVEGPALPAAGAPDLAPYLKALRLDRPWTILKWAMSADGRISPAPGRGGRISSADSDRRAHDVRGRCEAIAVGVGTVLADDCLLTCRLPGGPPDGRPQPLRVVFDSRLRTPPTSRLATTARESPVLVVCARGDPAARAALEARGVEVREMPASDGRVDLLAALRWLKSERGVRRLLVEGGARVHGSLLRHGIGEQVAITVAPRILGARGAPSAVEDSGFTDVPSAPSLEGAAWRTVGPDLLLEGYVRFNGRSDARS